MKKQKMKITNVVIYYSYNNLKNKIDYNNLRVIGVFKTKLWIILKK